MFVEIDEIAIKKDLLKRIKLGDKEALAQARKELSGITLYMHALSIDGSFEDWCTINIYEAHHLGIVDSVVIADFQVQG